MTTACSKSFSCTAAGISAQRWIAAVPSTSAKRACACWSIKAPFRLAGTPDPCLLFILHLERLERMDGGPVEHAAVHAELRSVTGTVPAPFEGIPVDMAAEMRTGGGMRVQHAALVAIGGDLLQAA